MRQRQPSKSRFSARRDEEPHAATVFPVSAFPDHAGGGHAIGEFHSAVMAQVQAFRDVHDSGLRAIRKTLQGEQQLMLLGAETFGASRLLTEMEEGSNLISELRQRAKVFRMQVVVTHVFLASGPPMHPRS